MPDVGPMATRRGATSKAATILLLCAVMTPQLGLTLLNPSTPKLAADLGTTIAAIQLTLSVYMAGYAVSMFVAGVLADRFDARTLQAWGMGIFAAGSVMAALAPNVVVLGIARFAQAVGGTSATVLTRLVIQRRYPADQHMSLLTSLSLVIAITPAVSPFLGAALAGWAPWRALFVVLACVGVLLAALFLVIVPSAPPSTTVAPTPGAVLRGVRQALRLRDFQLAAAMISLAWAGYFLFVEQSAYLLRGLHHLSAMGYGLLLIVPAVGYSTGSLLIRRMSSAKAAFLIGATCCAVGGVTLIGLAGVPVDSPAAVVVPLAVAFVGVGVVIPRAQATLLALGLASPGVGAGTFFFIQMAVGAAYSALVEALHLRSGLPIAIAIAAPLIGLFLLVGARHVAARRTLPSRLAPADPHGAMSDTEPISRRNGPAPGAAVRSPAGHRREAGRA